MAKELREGDGKAGIARAGKRKMGYDTAQVDAFLERAHALYDSDGINLTQQDIQSVSFDLTKDGYVISQVDAALHRLERAVVDKQTAWEISQQGRVAWKAQTEKLYQEIASHVERAERQRFKPGEPKHPSYDKKQVDRIADQVVDKAAAALGVDGVTEEDVRSLADLNASAVNNVIFTQRKGKKGYDERQVDYFLNVCVQLLSRLESYARIGDLVEPGAPQADDQESSAPTGSNATAPVEEVSPLISADVQRTVAAAAPTVAAVSSGESFDALRQAEQNLFPSPAASESPVVVTPNATVTPNPTPVAFEPSAPAAQPVSAPSAPAQSVSAQPAAAPVAPTAVPERATEPIARPQQTAQPAEPVTAAPSQPAGESRQFQSSASALPSFQPQAHPVSTAAEPTVAVTGPDADIVNHLSQGPTVTTSQDFTTANTNASLAALAHMAEVSQEMPAVEAPSFAPQSASFEQLNPITLNETPEQATPMPDSFAPQSAVPATSPAAPSTASTVPSGTDSSADAGTDAGSKSNAQPQGTSKDTSDSYSMFNSDFSLSIPDLSFPTLHTDNVKKEQ
ncbi:DivIVA domain-containing protein [Bifidobacterium sp. LC6]|uniref:DivIVA domain-containing protein n=1 Tax=Bifidobacterium colobi TaxID=2809026 RepID=A0ABS5UUU5_9BIFI|nr:DivIVA domain-containing protein [Bifidobacterium colobi]MBT1174775.1 DivIVA domain-containing protein [Bifidobacterium colobi]